MDACHDDRILRKKWIHLMDVKKWYVTKTRHMMNNTRTKKVNFKTIQQSSMLSFWRIWTVYLNLPSSELVNIHGSNPYPKQRVHWRPMLTTSRGNCYFLLVRLSSRSDIDCLHEFLEKKLWVLEKVCKNWDRFVDLKIVHVFEKKSHFLKLPKHEFQIVQI